MAYCDYMYLAEYFENLITRTDTITLTTETKDYSNYTLLQGIEKAANDIVNEIF